MPATSTSSANSWTAPRAAEPGDVSSAAMSRVARYGRAAARQGHGEELAGHLLAAADGLSSDPGCELYLISR